MASLNLLEDPRWEWYHFPPATKRVVHVIRTPGVGPIAESRPCATRVETRDPIEGMLRQPFKCLPE